MGASAARALGYGPRVIDHIAPRVLQTSRLTLRPPTLDDHDFLGALHGDPELYRHAPWARQTDPAAFALDFAGRRGMWAELGFGYWVVLDSAGEAIGFAGLRPAAPGRLNLYYRFAAAARGRGFAREVARAAVAHAAEWLPGHVVEAVVMPGHAASIRTAESAGLTLAGTRRHPGDPVEVGESLVLEGPSTERIDALDDELRHEVLALWSRVTDAGGSVGFLPGAPLPEIAAALAAHEDEMAADRAFAVALRDGSALAGWAWWTRSVNPLLGHGRWLYRFMVDPTRQGRNVGAILLAAATGLARADGAERLHLSYRSGSGLGDFYAKGGYVEVGRLPGVIRVAAGDDRDEVWMSRRVDGRPLVADGRR